MTDAWLSDNDRKEALSLAYIAAVAAKAGYATARWDHDRGSEDLLIKAKGGMFPQIAVQAKATAVADRRADGLHLQLSRKNYDDLRATRQTPLILVALELPADEAQWLDCTVDALVMRRCAFWLSLKGYPAIDVGSKTVVLPEANRLDPASLKDLMQRAREGVL